MEISPNLEMSTTGTGGERTSFSFHIFLPESMKQVLGNGFILCIPRRLAEAQISESVCFGAHVAQDSDFFILQPVWRLKSERKRLYGAK